LSVSAIISYFYRKQLETLEIPKVPDNFSLSIALIMTIIVLGILLPLFGLSIVIIFLLSKLKRKVALQT